MSKEKGKESGAVWLDISFEVDPEGNEEDSLTINVDEQVGTYSKDPDEKSYVMRCGEYIETDDVFDAWTSGDLDKMLSVLDVDTNPVERYSLLTGIVDNSYKKRTDPHTRDICRKISELHIQEFPDTGRAVMQDMEMNGLPKGDATFKYYATILAEDGEYEKAIEICEKALSFGLDDCTKSGYEGRITRMNGTKLSP